MRRILTIAAFALAVPFGTGLQADAQVKLKAPVTPRVTSQPKPALIIPPSVAVNRALRMVPNGTPLNVTLRGDKYFVKVKVNNKVRVVPIDAAGDAP
jgi:hypothetical protein